MVMSGKIQRIKRVAKRSDVRLLVLGWTLVCILSVLNNFVLLHRNGKSSDSERESAYNVFANWKPKRFIKEFIEIPPTEHKKKSNVHYSVEELSSLIFNDSRNLPSDVNCMRVMQGDETSIQTAALADLEFNSQAFAEKKRSVVLSDSNLNSLTTNCESFRMQRKYFTKSLSIEEKEFPIAYIITIHKQASMFERVLRSVYQVHNVYCIHVDAKSPLEFYETIQKIVGCFPNVFMSSERIDVHYSHWSRVEADLTCFKDLLKKKVEYEWKYVINLCGQDFPLKTNLDIVRSLKLLHGRNNLETVSMPSHKKSRYAFHFELPDNGKQYAIMKRTTTHKTEPPIDTPMFSGSAYYILSYEAVHYAMTNQKIQVFLKWNEDTFSPDEHIWATLHRMYSEFPGSEPPHPKYDQNELQSITRLVKWYGFKNPPYPVCAGRHLRGVCVYGAGDLPWLVEQHHLFANKFDDEKSAVTVECLDQWVRNKAIKQAIFYFTNGYV